MVSKKESEGIALLSMYGSDEDDDDMEQDDSGNKVVLVDNKEQGEVSGSEVAYMDEDDKVEVPKCNAPFKWWLITLKHTGLRLENKL